jgi:tripartite-type tricarboxylate transporter receptor subunit TctC
MKVMDAARRLALVALAAIGWIWNAPVHAQGAATYPDKPIVIVVAYAAGGSADQRAREVGQELSLILGKPFVIDN